MSIIEGQKINNTFFISINNPKSKNSMVLGFHPQLQSKIDEAENSKDINSIIIFGEGGFFCAGGDLNSLKTRRDMTVPERLETLEQLNGTIKKLKSVPNLQLQQLKVGQQVQVFLLQWHVTF